MPAVGNSVAFQVSIVTTGTPQQLPSNAIQNGGQFLAKTGNTANINISPSPTVSATNGYSLAAGTTVPFSGSNTNQLYIEGTSGDTLYFFGN
jgi:hypothetical protein